MGTILGDKPYDPYIASFAFIFSFSISTRPCPIFPGFKQLPKKRLQRKGNVPHPRTTPFIASSIIQMLIT